MAFNGSGTFSRLYDWTTDAANGVAISSTRMDAEMDGMATGLSNCITKDGQTTTTAAIPFATNVNLLAGADLIGSSTSDITINTDKFTVAGSTGNTVVAGTLGVTGVVTLGDGSEVDTKVIFDGNAQNYHIGLDDTTDDFVIGLGDTPGTTDYITINQDGQVGIGCTPSTYPLEIQSDSNADCLRFRGRASDDISSLVFVENDNSTVIGYIQGTVAGVVYSGNIHLSGPLICTSSTETISTGAIGVPTTPFVRIGTEGGASTDNLDTIGAGTDGQRITITANNTADTVVVKHNTGNIVCAGGADFSIDVTNDTMELIYNADIPRWCEISRSSTT